MSEIPHISVQALAQKIAESTDLPSDLQLVDVREPQELAIVQLPGFIHLPLSQAQQWSQDITAHLDPSKATYVLCHHGMRSLQMSGWLLQQGFSQVHNISGGIDAYAAQVDPSLPRY
jgi:rhodanese-related sulfurtransferase